MNSYELGNLRVVDLTKVLDPKTETRRCGLTRFNTGGPIPDFHTIMDLTSHLGTHVECPYHHNDDWTDVQGLPLTTFMGRAIYVNITHMEPNAKIKGEDLEKACGDRIKEGDIVIIDSPMKLAPFTPDSNTEKDKRLFICRETAEWFRDKKVKCVGFGDGVSIESNNDIDDCRRRSRTFFCNNRSAVLCIRIAVNGTQRPHQQSQITKSLIHCRLTK